MFLTGDVLLVGFGEYCHAKVMFALDDRYNCLDRLGFTLGFGSLMFIHVYPFSLPSVQ